MTPNLENKKYLNAGECGFLIGRSAAAVRNLVLRRAIPYRKPAGRLIFLRDEIEHWVEDAEGLRPEEINK